MRARSAFGRLLPRSFLSRSSLEVAPDLLGRVLVVERPSGTVAVRISEVEAYAGEDDPGSHAFRGRTPRNGVMYGPAGHLYVYFTYGMHWCANLVCDPPGVASAVLLRAGEVVQDIEVARERRPTAKADRDLARGPARLATALALGRTEDGADICAGTSGVRLRAGTSVPPESIRTGPRVGVSGPGGDGERYPWRFWIDADPTVSAYKPGVPRRRQ